MRVMLVYPKDIAENYFAKRPIMGIAYVGTVLSKSNHLIDLVDMRVKGYTLDSFERRLERFKPDIVGFSLVALSLDQALNLISLIKEKYPLVKIVCGGPEVTLLPKKMLEMKDVDFVVIGEGEFVMLELVECLENNKDYTPIKGLGYKISEKSYLNPSNVIHDLDKLPFPNWDLFNLKEYNHKISNIKFPVMTSRGCPYTCKFCDSVKVNTGYRVRSPKNVVDELEVVYEKYKNKNFQFMDDNFAIYKQRAIDICQEIINRGLHEKVTWVIGQGFSPSKGSYDLFVKMKEAGCIVVYFGIESADDEVLRAIRKPHTVAQVRQAVKDAKKAGLIVKAPFISGLPKSTYLKEKKYIDFFKELKIDMPKMCQLVPFPGTDMFEWVKIHAKPLIDLDSMHEKSSQTRGALDTDLFVPTFETDDFPLHERIQILKEFQTESEKYILQNLFGTGLGFVLFKGSRIKAIRKFGVKFLDIYYDQF